jgi:hypothetical protein
MGGAEVADGGVQERFRAVVARRADVLVHPDEVDDTEIGVLPAVHDDEICLRRQRLPERPLQRVVGERGPVDANHDLAHGFSVARCRLGEPEQFVPNEVDGRSRVTRRTRGSHR